MSSIDAQSTAGYRISPTTENAGRRLFKTPFAVSVAACANVPAVRLTRTVPEPGGLAHVEEASIAPVRRKVFRNRRKQSVARGLDHHHEFELSHGPSVAGNPLSLARGAASAAASMQRRRFLPVRVQALRRSAPPAPPRRRTHRIAATQSPQNRASPATRPAQQRFLRGVQIAALIAQ
jgi:hypothetical protein